MLQNWEEVHKAAVEGRSIAGVPHYFSKGDWLALSESYIRQVRDREAAQVDGQRRAPADRARGMYEKRLELEAKLAEASQAAGADARSSSRSAARCRQSSTPPGEFTLDTYVHLLEGEAAPALDLAAALDWRVTPGPDGDA